MPVCTPRAADKAQLTPLMRAIAIARGERRSADRALFRYRLRLVPLNDASEVVSGGERLVSAKDLSPWGIGIRHEAPLPYRRVRLFAADDRLRLLQLDDLEIDVVLRWCRFVGQGRYESGGKIARSAGASIASVA